MEESHVVRNLWVAYGLTVRRYKSGHSGARGGDPLCDFEVSGSLGHFVL